MWQGLAVVVALAGCLAPQASRCSDGRVCAPGLICVADQALCATPAQLAACATSSDGEHCVAADIQLGICTGGVCQSSGCGNGRVEPGEACDDGNTVSGDGCSADCASLETCGNTITDVGEQCDCGTASNVKPGCTGPNSDTSGLCGLTCQLRCGDGVVSPDEGCDPGASATVSCPSAVYDRGITTCSASCQPVNSPDTCRFIGWRTRGTQIAGNLVLGIAPTGTSKGYFIRGSTINAYVNYVSTGTPFVFQSYLRAVWAQDDETGFAVGDHDDVLGGLIVQRTSSTWTRMTGIPPIDLHGIWARNATDVYAVGDTSVLHLNDGQWSALPDPPIESGVLHALTGDAGHIYIAGDAGKIYSYDGSSWVKIDTGTTQDLQGVAVAENFLVAVGAAGTIVQNDGTGWRAGRTTTTADLLSVAGDTAQGFFATGARGTIVGYDGSVWRELALGRGVTGAIDQTIFAVGVSQFGVGAIGATDILTFEGAAWAPMANPTDATLYALWASAPDDVFAVGRNGTILHSDGLGWVKQDAPTTLDLRTVWGSGPTDVYAGGDNGTLLHYDGLTWTAGSLGGVSSTIEAVFASANEVDVAVDTGFGTTLSLDGVYRQTASALVQTLKLNNVLALWGSSPLDLFAADSLVGIEHYDVTGWSVSLASTTALETALSGSSPDVYAVGAIPYHFDGTAWSPGPFTDTDLLAVAAASPTNVFATGREGKLVHWDGVAVEPFVSRTTAPLNAVFATGNMMFMAGNDGTLSAMLFRE